MANKRSTVDKKRTYRLGIFAEKVAIFLLRLKGYKILQWRYKTKFGEIDLIAQKAKTIVFVEVKMRSSKIIIEEVLSFHQTARIKKAAHFFISQNSKFYEYNLRFDFVEVNKFFLPKHYLNFIS